MRLECVVDAISPAAMLRRRRAAKNGLARASLLHLPDYKRVPMMRARFGRIRVELQERDSPTVIVVPKAQFDRLMRDDEGDARE